LAALLSQRVRLSWPSSILSFRKPGFLLYMVLIADSIGLSLIRCRRTVKVAKQGAKQIAGSPAKKIAICFQKAGL